MLGFGRAVYSCLQGGTGLNTGLPLTENQKACNAQMKDAEKKRVAAAKIAAKPPKVDPPPKVDSKKAAAYEDRRRTKKAGVSAAVNVWAEPCRPWEEKGVYVL